MRKMNSLSLLAAACLACASLLCPIAAQADPPKVDSTKCLNVVVLLADDAGYADFGFQEVSSPDVGTLTPHIDSIATDGVRFTNAYMSGAVCSPSRAGLMTGRYQQRFGHERNIPPGYMKGGMALEEQTIANRMHALKFATGLVGKWHLGYPEKYQPQQRGFDWFFGLLQGSRSYLPIKKPTSHRVLQENGKALPEVGYVTDRFGTAAAQFIEKHHERPFFLFVSFTAPHSPLEAKPEDLKALAKIEKPRRRKYAGLVKSLDDNVGVILKALHKFDLEGNTLVVFTNDNGGQTSTGASNQPLRGRKGQLWEGGIRVPMAMRWPGQIEAGKVIEDPVSSLDLLPTFVSACNETVELDWKLDGINLLYRLTGKLDQLPERPLFWRSHGSEGPAAMRRGNMKLVVERGEEAAVVHLFDLEADLGEANNLAEERPKEVLRMRAELAKWEKELVEPLWGSTPRRKR